MPASVLDAESVSATYTRSSAPVLREWSALTAIACLVLLIHGYHPYTVDASIYVTGIKKVLHPYLYVPDNAFVVSHMRLSIFSRLMAAVITLFHISVDRSLLLGYFASTLLFLFACNQLAKRIFRSRDSIWGATFLVGVCFTLPVAATSLLIMDPYLTARSFSAPLSLLAIVACTDRHWAQAALWCALTALLHPLMAIHLAAFSLVFFCIDRRRWKTLVSICTSAFLLCGVVYELTLKTSVTASYREAVLSRSYYFLSGWHLYELVGIVLPLALLGIVALAAKRTGIITVLSKLALTGLLIGSVSALCSLCFVHQGGPYFLMRLQPLRSFHSIYVIGTIMLGGYLAPLLRNRTPAFALGLLGLAATGMFFAERQVYALVPNLEMPGIPDANPWRNAFLWIRLHTPQNAVFAAEPHWLDSGDESIPGFRAISERSILTDIKDEGVASLFPSISETWEKRRNAELGIDSLNDTERIRRLQPLGASWLLLSPQAKTELPCPYRNTVVAVCRLP